MDKKLLLAAIAAVLTTALECQPCPESAVYMALGSDMGRWEVVRGVMTGSGLITIKGHSIGLTDKGRTLAQKIKGACPAVA